MFHFRALHRLKVGMPNGCTGGIHPMKPGYCNRKRHRHRPPQNLPLKSLDSKSVPRNLILHAMTLTTDAVVLRDIVVKVFFEGWKQEW